MVDQRTINLAILGDKEAIEECNKAGYILPCPQCGYDKSAHSSLACSERNWRTCSRGLYEESVSGRVGIKLCYFKTIDDDGGSALEHWNESRPDLTAIAKELYAPKWEVFDSKNPPKDQYIMKHDPFGVVHGSWDAIKNHGHITHWMPMPQPPEA